MPFCNFYKRLGSGPLIAAHRGWREIRPENTLPAFEAAVGECDFIELDIQLSRDGRWFVCHDPSLERTTDIETHYPERLRPFRLADYRADELKRLDAGAWFIRRDPFGAIGRGLVKKEAIEKLLPIRLPRLEEVLDFAKKSRMPLNIEIKDMLTRRCEEVVESFLDTLYEDDLPPVLISSFNHRYLRHIHHKAPHIPLAALVEGSHPPDLIGYLKRVGACAYHVDRALADSTPVASLHREGIVCGVYVINDPVEKERLASAGFRAFFSDSPEVLR